MALLKHSIVTLTRFLAFSTLLFVLFACVVTSAADPVAQFKDCLSACVMCVELFGKTAYDGRKCLFSCQLTRGNSIDSDCTNEIFHIVH